VWITDSATDSVHVFDTVSGAYREFRRLEGVALQMPAGIATDAQGRVYMTDSASGSVYVFDQKGEYDHLLISRKSSRLLESPTAIVIAENGGTIYVVDPPRHAVIALNREGEAVGRIPLPDELNDPSGIAVVDIQVYVLGENQHRVEIFSPDGRLLGEKRWDGVRAPSAFAWDAVRRRFLVANPQLMVIEIFNEAGQGLGAFGQRGEGVEQVEGIDSIYFDPEGLVYAVDSRHGKVLVYSESQQR
jgi:DNA-binding beta-propeller fold protein YncE